MLRSKVARRFLGAVILLFFTLVFGILGFHWIEGYSYLDSAYMTVITMSTVGFEVLGGEGFSNDGKLFVIFLIIFTIGFFTYTVSTITSFMVEGEIRNLIKGYRMTKEISKMHDHIIICGLGRNGRQAAIELMAEKAPFIGLEMHQEVIDQFLQDFPDALILKGDATDEDVLRQANIHVAKGAICALADDAANVFVTLGIRQLNATLPIVARASNESTIKKLEIAGANKVILPNVLGGRQMAKVLTKPALMDFVDLVTGRGQFHLNLEMIDCTGKPQLVGKTLVELNIRSRTGVLVLGLQDGKGDFHMNPNGNLPINNNEKLFVIGTDEQVRDFYREFT
ncbi:MAG: potassium channel protein [Bacteroidetes bacterium]|nr:potassium channel protein [Bacteroidota bacterium]